MPSNVLPVRLSQTFRSLFEFSLKVMRSNPGYPLKSSLLYYFTRYFPPLSILDSMKSQEEILVKLL